MNVDEWLRYGIDHGFCGPVVCSTHDGVPTTAEEDMMQGEGDDPCIWVLRLYDDDVMRNDVETNHSPSQWRKQ